MSTFEKISKAISTLKERGGSSLPAIKKFMIQEYGSDFTAGSDKSNLVRLEQFVWCVCGLGL